MDKTDKKLLTLAKGIAEFDNETIATASTLAMKSFDFDTFLKLKKESLGAHVPNYETAESYGVHKSEYDLIGFAYNMGIYKGMEIFSAFLKGKMDQEENEVEENAEE